MRDTAQQLLNGIFLGSIYALFAVGYTLVFGVLDVLNLAHSAVFMLGAVFAYSLAAIHGAPFWLATIGAVGGGAVMGVGIEFVCLRPLRRRNAPPVMALISTIGLALILVAIVEQAHPGSAFGWLWHDGANSVSFPPGKVPSRVFHVFGLIVPETKVAILVMAILLMGVLSWVTRRTGAGRAMRAVAENPRAARLLGIDVNRVFLATLAASSALAALAGVLYGAAISDISPYIGRDQVELRGLAVIVLGGMGSVTGSVVGGYVLALIEVVTLLTLGSNVRAAIAFAALFVVLVLRPQGLFGTPMRERV
jgi:branched-chain amino acid transport system permease protein